MMCFKRCGQSEDFQLENRSSNPSKTYESNCLQKQLAVMLVAPISMTRAFVLTLVLLHLCTFELEQQ